MPPSFRPSDFVSIELWPEGAVDHDLCLATGLCRICGASRQAIATGVRRPYCEPGVVGISWVRAVERMRDQMVGFERAFGPMVDVPFGGKINGPPDEPPPSAA